MGQGKRLGYKETYSEEELVLPWGKMGGEKPRKQGKTHSERHRQEMKIF